MRLLLFLILFSVSSVSAKNVVILLADDLGLETSISNSSSICQTPNLDALASRSTNFRNAFTPVSSCSPSRASLLSGLPPHQNGAYGLHHDVHHFSSFDQVLSLAHILKTSANFTSAIIGKKHVGPSSVFKFDFEQTEENHSILQVGRNITLIKNLVRQFLDSLENENFLLYVGFHDAHRCEHTHPELGAFCEHFGTNNTIPDWNPVLYDPNDVAVPYYTPDTLSSRLDIAAQYQTISRLDQGVGLVLKELKSRNLLDDTLIIFTSDNGSPFTNGRTNLYDPGVRVPLWISNPDEKSGWSTTKKSIVSLLDLMPSVLDWLQIPSPTYLINGRETYLTGTSLIPLTKKSAELPRDTEIVFASHVMHEVTMNYPMRSARSLSHKVIHNLNYWAPFPIDQDFYLSGSFQELLKATRDGHELHWSKNLTSYYFRSEFECFNMSSQCA
ncbi:N-sulfoglucosamine sulfohydrolase [Halotydeus destructor]|nr:N-sulfoglucosamine sulfohydrolase [Halotydeus destructor]